MKLELLLVFLFVLMLTLSATTTQCVKRRRKESTQLACVLQTVEARAQQPHVVTHKRYRKDYVNISKTVKKQ